MGKKEKLNSKGMKQIYGLLSCIRAMIEQRNCYFSPGLLRVNQGSTFAFYIPVNNVHLIEASRNRARVSRDKIRALVVDDYAYNRDLHKLLVEREGVQQVVTACDGKEAVERYISKGDDYYDFIMMDVQMPEMDGFTAAKKIRQYEEEKKWKRVDIYFVSGEYYSEEDIVSELRTKGQMDTGVRCLRKPLGIDMIRKIVQNYGVRIKLPT